MRLKLASLTLLLSVQLETCKSQCNGTAKQISENGTVFQFPNFECEYGRKADCEWRTKGSRDHVTVLHVIRLNSLHVRTAGNASCKSSQKLSIKGVTVPDKLFIGDGTSATCYAIPSDRNFGKCGTLRDFGICKFLKQSRSVTVIYNSTGCKKSSTDELGEDFVRGFRIKYEIFRCDDINQETVGLITQRKSLSGYTNEISFSPVCGPPSFNNTTTERLKDGPTNFSTTERPTDYSTNERPTNYSSTVRPANEGKTDRLPVRKSREVMFYGLAAGGGFAAFMCVTGVVCYFVKRGKRRSSSPEHRQLEVEVSCLHKSSENAYDNVAETHKASNDYQQTCERRETIVECAYEITNTAGAQYEVTGISETPGYHVPFAEDNPSIEARYEPFMSEEQVRVADVEYEIMAHAHIEQPAYEPMFSDEHVRVPESEYEM